MDTHIKLFPHNVVHLGAVHNHKPQFIEVCIMLRY